MKNSYGLKKIIAAIMVISLIFSFAACGKNTNQKDSGSDTGKSDIEGTRLDDCVFLYKGFSIETDAEGNNCLIAKYDFTNNGDTAENFDWAINPKYYQNGAELEYSAIPVKSGEAKSLDDGASMDIKPKDKIEVMTTYKLKDLKTPVKVICESKAGGEKAEFQIDITK